MADFIAYDEEDFIADQPEDTSKDPDFIEEAGKYALETGQGIYEFPQQMISKIPVVSAVMDRATQAISPKAYEDEIERQKRYSERNPGLDIGATLAGNYALPMSRGTGVLGSVARPLTMGVYSAADMAIRGGNTDQVRDAARQGTILGGIGEGIGLGARATGYTLRAMSGVDKGSELYYRARAPRVNAADEIKFAGDLTEDVSKFNQIQRGPTIEAEKNLLAAQREAADRAEEITRQNVLRKRAFEDQTSAEIGAAKEAHEVNARGIQENQRAAEVAARENAFASREAAKEKLAEAKLGVKEDIQKKSSIPEQYLTDIQEKGYVPAQESIGKDVAKSWDILENANIEVPANRVKGFMQSEANRASVPKYDPETKALSETERVALPDRKQAHATRQGMRDEMENFPPVWDGGLTKAWKRALSQGTQYPDPSAPGQFIPAEKSSTERAAKFLNRGFLFKQSPEYKETTLGIRDAIRDKTALEGAIGTETRAMRPKIESFDPTTQQALANFDKRFGTDFSKRPELLQMIENRNMTPRQIAQKMMELPEYKAYRQSVEGGAEAIKSARKTPQEIVDIERGTDTYKTLTKAKEGAKEGKRLLEDELESIIKTHKKESAAQIEQLEGIRDSAKSAYKPIESMSSDQASKMDLRKAVGGDPNIDIRQNLARMDTTGFNDIKTQNQWPKTQEAFTGKEPWLTKAKDLEVQNVFKGGRVADAAKASGAELIINANPYTWARGVKVFTSAVGAPVYKKIIDWQLRNPRLSKFAGIIKSAAARGPQSWAAMHSTYMNRDQEYANANQGFEADE